VEDYPRTLMELERTSRHRGKLFYRLLEQAVAVEPVPYAAMVKGVRGLRRRRHPNRS